MVRIIFSLFLILISFKAFANADPAFATAPHVEVRFISANQALVRGEVNHLAFHFNMEKHWHIYWKNPGDSGKEPRIKWLKKDSLMPSEFIWPAPTKVPLETLMNYGYEGKIALPIKVKVPKDFSNDKVKLNAELTWLVCKVECVPGKANLTLTLPVADSSQPSKYYTPIQQSLNTVPLKDSNIVATFEMDDNIQLNIDLTKANLPEIQSAYFFPTTELAIEYAAKQVYDFKDNHLKMILEKNLNIEPGLRKISGVLELRPKDKNLPKITYDISAYKEGEETGLLISLVFAFIGGLILNLMPCVFPVLSLKILGFVHQAKDQPKKIRNHGWYYTLGVLSAFWVLTIGLIILRSSGEAVGWGFQLQSPYFVTAMAFLFFFIGLNLLGVFEVGESLSAVEGTRPKEGYLSSFQTGILATIVATPCTAPFMGVAIGAVLAMSYFATFLVFTSLALGMAFPYLLLSYFPQWLKVLPKPGIWMKKLKELLAFPMFLTMIWLLWVLSQQASPLFIFIFLLACLSIYFLFWLHSYYKKIKIALLILGAVIIATTFIQLPSYSAIQRQVSSSDWIQYSEDKLQSLRDEGKAVFIDFTASWCITCQVNKKMVLNNDDIRMFFEQNNIVTMQADWTNHDEAITNKLAEFGRNSVPVYVYYPPNQGEPVVLPEILSKSLIKDLML